MICYLKYGFRGSNRSLLCSIRNLYNYILSLVSRELVSSELYTVRCGIKSSNLFEDSNTVCVGIVALVLLLNTYARFREVSEVCYAVFGTK